jgi:tetratricopeptide (TPR) repeat protein
MAHETRTDTIDELFRRGEWQAAQTLLENERAADPENHWLLTQLGVTYYEQRRYEEALLLFLTSLKIVGDCPLTLWNLAGTLDALGKSSEAIEIFRWLLESKKSAEDDPCWESKEWTDALKADCVYRLGVCFQHLGKKRTAEHCFRQYVDLLLLGIDGLYSIEDAMRQIRTLHGAGKHNGVEGKRRAAVQATLQAAGGKPTKGRRRTPPAVDVEALLSAHTGTTGK